jgi:hypothetical protein
MRDDAVGIWPAALTRCDCGLLCGAGAEQAAVQAPAGEAAEAAEAAAADAAPAPADAAAAPAADADAAAPPVADAVPPAPPPARARRVQFAPLPPPLAAAAEGPPSQGACTQDAVATLAVFASEAAATLPICAALAGCATPVACIINGLPKGVRQLLPALGARTLGELGALKASVLSKWPQQHAEQLLRRLRDAAAAMPKAVVEGGAAPVMGADAELVDVGAEDAPPPLPAAAEEAEEAEAMDVAEAPPCADVAAAVPLLPDAPPPAAEPAPLPCALAPAPARTAAASADVAWLFSELSRLAAAPQWRALDDACGCDDGTDGDGDVLMEAQGAVLGMSVRLHAALARRAAGIAAAAVAPAE